MLDVKIRCARRRAAFEGWKILPRRICDYEFVYVRSGYGEIMIEGRQISVGAGDFICFRPKSEHSLWLDKEPYMDFFLVHFSPVSDEAKELVAQIPDLVHLADRHLIESLMKRIYDEGQRVRYLGALRQELTLMQIICEILTRLHREQNPTGAIRVGRVLEYIHENPCREYTLEELLRVADIKKTVFLQSFKEVTGTTPIQYVNALRLDTARDLLLESDLSVAQIAERCGFGDPFYFSRSFKKKYSVSPQKYRAT